MNDVARPQQAELSEAIRGLLEQTLAETDPDRQLAMASAVGTIATGARQFLDALSPVIQLDIPADALPLSRDDATDGSDIPPAVSLLASEPTEVPLPGVGIVIATSVQTRESPVLSPTALEVLAPALAVEPEAPPVAEATAESLILREGQPEQAVEHHMADSAPHATPDHNNLDGMLPAWRAMYAALIATSPDQPVRAGDIARHALSATPAGCSQAFHKMLKFITASPAFPSNVIVSGNGAGRRYAWGAPADRVAESEPEPTRVPSVVIDQPPVVQKSSFPRPTPASMPQHRPIAPPAPASVADLDPSTTVDTPEPVISEDDSDPEAGMDDYRPDALHGDCSDHDIVKRPTRDVQPEVSHQADTEPLVDILARFSLELSLNGAKHLSKGGIPLKLTAFEVATFLRVAAHGGPVAYRDLLNDEELLAHAPHGTSNPAKALNNALQVLARVTTEHGVAFSDGTYHVGTKKIRYIGCGASAKVQDAPAFLAKRR